MKLFRRYSFASAGFTILVCCFLISCQGEKKQDGPWKGHKSAVVLSYDDGLNEHLDIVAPTLDSAELKGSFYIPGNASTLDNRLKEWEDVAKNGHELGNHTLFHPCVGKSEGREWVKSEYDLDNYTLTRILDEIKMASTLLKAIDGKENRTFAYTCGDRVVEDTVFAPYLEDDILAARDVIAKMEQPGEIDWMRVGAFVVDGHSGKELIALAEKARKNGALIVFLFHGVGGGHSLNVSAGAHKELVEYLANRSDQFWIAPLSEIARHYTQ
ncbi:MAG: polysaccharide deacetylase family protein [Marinilabiliaceae bacterium]